MKLFCLDGRVALVTGGNGGLGLAMARGLRDAGATVVVTGRDRDKNRASKLAVLRLDVRSEAQVARTFRRAVKRFGRLDILVNNAGVFQGGAAVELAASTWDEVVDTNLKGAFLCAKWAARAMIERGQGGKIINVGSMFSVLGHHASIGYTASKTGIVGLTRALAVELAPHDIQVNAILPGWFPTRMCRGLPALPRGRRIRTRTPAGRFGHPDDLAGVAVFLASPASAFVTGAAIPVDGGYLVGSS